MAKDVMNEWGKKKEVVRKVLGNSFKTLKEKEKRKKRRSVVGERTKRK